MNTTTTALTATLTNPRAVAGAAHVELVEARRTLAHHVLFYGVKLDESFSYQHRDWRAALEARVVRAADAYRTAKAAWRAVSA